LDRLTLRSVIGSIARGEMLGTDTPAHSFQDLFELFSRI
jgi:hypothetical protein